MTVLVMPLQLRQCPSRLNLEAQQGQKQDFGSGGGGGGGSLDDCTKGRYQNYLPVTTNLSQKLTQPSKGSVTQLVTFADVSENELCPLPLHSNPKPPTEKNGFL